MILERSHLDHVEALLATPRTAVEVLDACPGWSTTKVLAALRTLERERRAERFFDRRRGEEVLAWRTC